MRMNINAKTVMLLSNNVQLEHCTYNTNKGLVYATIISQGNKVLDVATYPTEDAMLSAVGSLMKYAERYVNDFINEDPEGQELATHLVLKACGMSDAEIQGSKAWQGV